MKILPLIETDEHHNFSFKECLCNNCHENTVSRTDPSTGHFFLMEGYPLERDETNPFGTETTIPMDPREILIAICSRCIIGYDSTRR